MTEAMVQEKTIIEYADNELSRTIKQMWKKVLERLEI